MKIAVLSKSELAGTQYIEFVRGRYSTAVWGDESLYLEESIIGFLEGTIVKVFPRYDHFQFQFLDVPVAAALGTELLSLAATLEKTDDPSFVLDALAQGGDGIRANAVLAAETAGGSKNAVLDLALVAGQLGRWFQEAARSAGGASILGM